MPRRVFHAPRGDNPLLRDGVGAIQRELGVTAEFPAEVEEAAAAAVAKAQLPDVDRTDLEFVTIDPAGARDLDQALHIERDGDGYVVHYAIADLATFVTPGDPVDVEAHRRGETLYGPDSKVPLHPPAISEGAASLLPGEVRPALVWTLRVDAAGEGIAAFVERARVKSREQLTYDEAQRRLDSGSASPSLALLREVGEKRLLREQRRGGVSLPLPDQEIYSDDGHWRLGVREQLPVERWNAQISLLTGMGAASLMMYARVGILRTLPPPDPRDLKRLHRTARALDISWPAEMLYADFVRSLDPARPRHAAMLVASTTLLRGSGYVGFDGELPADPEHAALAGEYAHVTAPLRRLVDRFGLEVCVALSADRPVPGWVLAELPTLPEVMRESARRANAYERAVLDLVEAATLSGREGEAFSGVVVEVEPRDDRRGVVQIAEPAIEAPVSSEAPLPLGESVQAVLVEADPRQRRVRFEVR